MPCHESFKAILLIAVLLPTRLAVAQGVIAGYAVQARSNRPLRCIDVSLVDSAGRTVSATRTREEGMFEFESPAPGVYRLRFSALGIMPVESPPDTLGPTTEFERVFRLEISPADSLTRSRQAADGSLVAPASLGFGKPPLFSNEMLGARGVVTFGFVLDSLGRPDTSALVSIAATDAKLFRFAPYLATAVRFGPARRDGAPVCSFYVMRVQLGPGGGPK